jgi:hypothetical protein
MPQRDAVKIDPLVYTARFPEGCRPEACRSRCCRFGVWVDLEEMRDIREIGRAHV